MASPMQMIEAVADALGVDLATVVSHDRNLVTAGHRTKGGRGTSAARMTARDAANLIIAVAGADQVQSSAQAIDRFASLTSVGSRSGIRHLRIDAGHSFQEVLIEILEGFKDGSFRGADEVYGTFEMTRPNIEASIDFTIDGYRYERKYKRSERCELASDREGDLQIIARFSISTLWQVGEMLGK